MSKLEQLPFLLVKNRADMMINSSNWINWWSKKIGIFDEIVEIENENIFFSRFHFVFMLSKKSDWVNKGLIRAMDEELKEMKKSGEWQEILKKYEDPHGYGKPFKTQLNTDKYYLNYEDYPIYKK